MSSPENAQELTVEQKSAGPLVVESEGITVEDAARGAATTGPVVSTPARKKATIYMGIPTYLNRLENVGAMFSVIHGSKDNYVGHSSISSSANCLGFNKLWIEALNQRPKFTHFLMLHSDIVPMGEHWIDKLVALMEKTGADVLSVVSPIKDEKGFTSTALDEPVGTQISQRWRVRRLTMHEVFKRPPTWTEPKLLINTGVMLVDIRKPWVDKIHFHFDDDIIVDAKGRKRAVCFPEDWNFSRDARNLGASLWATREIPIQHFGPSAYMNTEPWGTKVTDADVEESPELRTALDVMEAVKGWFTREEGGSLYEAAARAVKVSPVFVEVGSWKGRSTMVLGYAAKRRGAKLYAVDPHEGDLHSQGKGIKTEGTLEEFEKNVVAAGIRDVVTTVAKKSTDVVWKEENGKIGLLFIDGKHDYESVSKDFKHFEPHLHHDGYVAFHDYNEPDVKRFVDEVVETGQYEPVSEVGSLKVIHRVDWQYRQA